MSTEPAVPRDPADGSGRRLHPALARCLPGFFFAGVTLLFAWPALLGRSTSAVPGLQALLWPWRGVVDTSPSPALQTDGAASSYPWSVGYHEALRQFELPFWDWHSFTGGYDLASDGVAGAMYPVHWLLWGAFEPPRAHDAYVVLHLWAGGLVMFMLLRHWRLASGPALVGGTVWMLAPFNVGWVQAEMIAPVLVIVPLAFWAVSAAIAQGSWQRVFGASAAIALAMVAGNLVVFMVVVWIVGLYAAATWIVALARRRPAAELARRAGTLVLVALGAFALSAYSLVPTLLNLLSLSRRPSQLEQVLPLQGSASDVLLSLWDPPALDSTIALFMLHWCGRVALVLAVVGLFHRGSRRVLGLVLVLFFTLMPVTPWLVHVGWYAIPPLRAVSGFGRLAFLGSFGMAILAASGTAVLLSLLRRVWARTSTTRRTGRLDPLLGALVAGVVVVELLPFALAINPPWTDPEDTPLMPVTGAQESLTRGEREWPGLVLPLASVPAGAGEPTGYSFWGATSHVGGVDSVGGYDSAVPTRATAFTQVMQGISAQTAVQPIGGAFLPNFGVEWTRLDLAERAGVTHVYAPPGVSLTDSVYAAAVPELRLVHDDADGQVWELARPMRGPRLVGRAFIATSTEDALARFAAPEHDAREVVVLERRGRSSAAGLTPDSPGDGPVGTVRSARRGYDGAVVDVDAERGAWLVMPIGYAPGWRADMNGQALAIRPADGAMSAVRVPAGDHTITFTYRPRGFRAGALATLAALLAALALLVATRVRGRRVTAEAPPIDHADEWSTRAV